MLLQGRLDLQAWKNKLAVLIYSYQAEGLPSFSLTSKSGQLIIVDLFFSATIPNFFGFQSEEREAEMNTNLEAKERELEAARDVIQALRTQVDEQKGAFDEVSTNKRRIP